MSSSDSSPSLSGDPRRVKCPDCPDGQLWNERGPTDDACPTCGGEAFIWTTEPDDDE